MEDEKTNVTPIEDTTVVVKEEKRKMPLWKKILIGVGGALGLTLVVLGVAAMNSEKDSDEKEDSIDFDYDVKDVTEESEKSES